MRKYFLVIIILSFVQLAFSQTKKENLYALKKDSLVAILPSLQDSARIDCLNFLSSIYVSDLLGTDYKKEVDTAYIYANQSNAEAKKLGYKRGLGYSYLRIGEAIYTKGEIEYNGKYNPDYFNPIEQNAKQAIQIGEIIGDNTLLGNSYFLLASLSDQKNEQKEEYVSNAKKAISYFQKPGNQKHRRTYTELNEAICEGCEGNEIRLGNLYIELARFYGNQKDESSAVTQANNAIIYFQKASDKGGLGGAYSQLANSDFRQLHMESAKKNAEISLQYIRETGNELALVVAYINLGNWCLIWTDFENGLEYGKKCLAILEKISNDKEPGIVYKWHWSSAYQLMCQLYVIGGDYETALKILEKGRAFYSEKQTGYNMVWLSMMGEVQRLLGNKDSAMYYLAKFENRMDGGNRSLIKLYIDLRQYDKALELSQVRIEIARKRNWKLQLAADLTLAADIYTKKNDYKKALAFLKEARPLFVKPNSSLIIMENYRLLSEAYYSTRKTDSAYFYLKQYMNLKDSLLNRQFLWKLNSSKKEAEEERKTSQINLLNKNNQLKEQKLKQQGLVRNGLIAGIILLLLLGVFAFRNILLKRKNERLRMQKNLELHQLESEKKQAELEMQALRAQMNPHFIFNCLSSINRFILKNESKVASNYLTRFSRLMRMVLLNSQKPLIALEDELQMLGLYLEMERLRFKNSFDYGITILNTVDSDNIFIPPLLLQPFCENAIWHGLMHKEGPGRLDIELSMQDNILNCTLTDNGVGREKAEEMNSKTAEKDKSMGLKITTERLALFNRGKNMHTFYEIEDLKDDDGNGAGTRVILKISFKESEKEVI